MKKPLDVPENLIYQFVLLWTLVHVPSWLAVNHSGYSQAKFIKTQSKIQIDKHGNGNNHETRKSKTECYQNGQKTGKANMKITAPKLYTTGDWFE